MTRGAVNIGIKSISSGILDGSFLDSVEKDVSKIMADQVDKIVADKLKNTKNDKLAIKNFKSYLASFSDKYGNGLPIIFIIDALDRCRPDFALELLEKIKHLFSVRGITFLLVINREQLEESIKSKYGAGINSSQYLQKFINLWITLPRKYGQNHDDHGVKYMKMVFNSMLNEKEMCEQSDAIELLSELIRYLKPSYREIEKILTYFSIIHNSSENTSYYSYFQMLYAFVCYLKVSKPDMVVKNSH